MKVRYIHEGCNKEWKRMCVGVDYIFTVVEETTDHYILDLKGVKNNLWGSTSYVKKRKCEIIEDILYILPKELFEI